MREEHTGKCIKKGVIRTQRWRERGSNVEQYMSVGEPWGPLKRAVAIRDTDVLRHTSGFETPLLTFGATKLCRRFLWGKKRSFLTRVA